MYPGAEIGTILARTVERRIRKNEERNFQSTRMSFSTVLGVSHLKNLHPVTELEMESFEHGAGEYLIHSNEIVFGIES